MRFSGRQREGSGAGDETLTRDFNLRTSGSSRSASVPSGRPSPNVRHLERRPAPAAHLAHIIDFKLTPGHQLNAGCDLFTSTVPLAAFPAKVIRLPPPHPTPRSPAWVVQYLSGSSAGSTDSPAIGQGYDPTRDFQESGRRVGHVRGVEGAESKLLRRGLKPTQPRPHRRVRRCRLRRVRPLSPGRQSKSASRR